MQIQKAKELKRLIEEIGLPEQIEAELKDLAWKSDTSGTRYKIMGELLEIAVRTLDRMASEE